MDYYQEQPPPSGYRKGFNTTLGVVGALFVVFVLLPLAGCVACAVIGGGLAEQGESSPARVGQMQTIREGNDAIEVTLRSLSKSRTLPARIAPMEGIGRRGAWAIADLEIKNTGEKFIDPEVSMWSTLDCDTQKDIQAEWLGDLQGSDGRLELDPGQSGTWKVVFRVRKAMRLLSFTYQGPGDTTVTWTVE